MADGIRDLDLDESVLTIMDNYETVDDNPNLPPDDMDILNLDDDANLVLSSCSGSSPSSTFGFETPAENGANGQSELAKNNREQLAVDGVLDEEIIEQGLSNLGRSADGTQQAFLHLSIPGYKLRDISLLGEYVHLQKVEVPYNEITDLSPLSNMPYLLELDASHNQLTTLLDFKPPNNLKIVNVSYNEINEMCDLSAHHYLARLIIDNNNISEIKGIEKCKRLKYLSLAHNQIESIKGLNHLPLTYLNLSFNSLTKIENLETLTLLRTIDLSGNQIRSMNGLQKHEFLETIDLEDNEVIDLAEVHYIQPLALIRELNLQRNPIRELPDYRLSVIYYLQQLTELDRRKVEVDEKVAASNMFSPPMEVLAARDHIMHVVYSFLQPSKVLDSTLPSIDTPYPMLVLVGPQGAGKADLAQKLVEEFSDYFGYGVTHTTRRPCSEEKQGIDHHFVTLEEFEESIKMGRFLYTYSYQGDLYGLTLEAIETAARDGLACIVVMEIEGVLTLKNTHYEPRYVLVLPMSSDIHERRLREKGTYTETQIQMTLTRDELYANYNREHPGFFDVVIGSDDIIEAYKQLRRLVMEYLGISAPSPSVSDVEPSTAGSALDKEGTMDTMTGQSNLVRQWSKLSITDSLSQAINSLKVKSAPSPMPTTGRGIVEELSIRRRESAAKQAVSGQQPTIYEQLLQNAPHTVPLAVSDQVGLGEDKRQHRSYSAPMNKNDNMDALPPSSLDSSLPGSGGGSSLSDISEACDMERNDPGMPEGSLKDSEDDFILPSEAVDMINLLSASESNNFPESVPLAPRPNSGSHQLDSPRPGSNMSGSRSNSRLGSERHKVLPPIAV